VLNGGDWFGMAVRVRFVTTGCSMVVLGSCGEYRCNVVGSDLVRQVGSGLALCGALWFGMVRFGRAVRVGNGRDGFG